MEEIEIAEVLGVKKMQADVLIIDDDKSLSKITAKVLEKYGYAVHCCDSAEDAYEYLKKTMPKLIILDINMPGDNGFAFCRELRKTSTLPVLFVSARTSENDRITGLELGADDYISKPYSLQELLSRVKATMRRTYGFSSEEKKFDFGTIHVEVENRTVKKNGEIVKLSLREFDVLLYLLEHPNQVISKEELFSKVWGGFSETELGSLAVHIRWLRQKLEDDPAKPEYITTVWGIGYRFEMGDSYEGRLSE